MAVQRVPLRASIYLAGPIGGLSWDEATGWRDNVTELLKPMVARSPLRSFEDGADIKKSHFTTDGRPTATPDTKLVPFNRLFQRDYMDCHQVDAIFFNMQNAPKKSIGTTCELAWGFRRGIPMVVVMPAGNINEDPFLLEMIHHRVNTLAEGVNKMREIFGWPTYDSSGAE